MEGSEVMVTGRVKSDVMPCQNGTIFDLTISGFGRNGRFTNVFTDLCSKSTGEKTEYCKLELTQYPLPDEIDVRHADGLDEIETENFLERLWAFQTIKEALDKNQTDKARDLALQYNFVTPVTSLILTDPQLNVPLIVKPKEFKVGLQIRYD